MNMMQFTDSQLKVFASQGGTRGRSAEIELKNRELVKKFTVSEKGKEQLAKSIETPTEFNEKLLEAAESVKPRRGRKKKVQENVDE